LASFEEREPIGVEEVAVAGGHLQIGMAGAVVNEAEQGEELGPSTVAGVHGVGMALGVGLELLEQAVNAVVASVELGGRHEVAVFGKEEEDETHEDIEQALVDLLGALLKNVAEEVDAGLGVCRAQTSEEFVESIEHLGGEGGGDVRLELAALVQEACEGFFVPSDKDPPFLKEKVESTKHGAARDLGHAGDREGQRAGILSRWSVVKA